MLGCSRFGGVGQLKSRENSRILLIYVITKFHILSYSPINVHPNLTRKTKLWREDDDDDKINGIVFSPTKMVETENLFLNMCKLS